ncbi:lactonase family protein [Reichenbachiella agarivorans]|uniref:Lactonase family protein n=1 Tax=Reichenbachiella agarivorans TaxID=2979464 RepID=A0ABY6CQJ2_9BACT|nr:lactonase family protein [Reichenbachiella agarivorans]UXP32766.1 lactonase family protein [Reichenbachiella agarivorans]
MIRSLLILFLTFLMSCGLYQGADEYWVYVSSSSDVDESGIGIYNWNPSTGKLNYVSKESTIKTSSYLTIDAENQRLYSINGEGIQGYQIDVSTGQLSLINQIGLTGDGPCYVGLADNRQYLMVAYYSSGTAVSYALDAAGRLGDEISRVQHEGSSINTERQEKAHTHMILPAPEGDLVVVTDLGVDQVLTYRVSQTGEFNPQPVSVTQVEAGYGPRHVAFHPNNRYIYVLAELTGHVMAYHFDSEKGIGDLIGVVSILPSDFTEFNKSADIHITPDGQYLYASNRGDNSLAICQINPESGDLIVVDIRSCGGEWPRAFEIEPSGEYILVANKRSDFISVLDLDTETGLYKKVEEIHGVVSPQCIKFLKK